MSCDYCEEYLSAHYCSTCGREFCNEKECIEKHDNVCDYGKEGEENAA